MDTSRNSLIDAVSEFLGQELLSADDIREALSAEIDSAGPEALASLKANLVADRGWDFRPRDPLVQRIHHRLAAKFLTPESRLVGAEHLAAIADVPVVIVSNHLSYADANVIEVILQRGGGQAVANRLTAIAGPKVFTSRERRFSSLCFGTIKVPQSTDVASEEAVLNAREVARAARQSIQAAHDRLDAGDALLLFGEGTRSRTASMQPMLPAVARYIERPGTWVLPIGLTGSEQMFPIDNAALRPATITVTVGAPFSADALLAVVSTDRRAAMDKIGEAIAALLPPSYQGVYALEN